MKIRLRDRRVQCKIFRKPNFPLKIHQISRRIRYFLPNFDQLCSPLLIMLYYAKNYALKIIMPYKVNYANNSAASIKLVGLDTTRAFFLYKGRPKRCFNQHDVHFVGLELQAWA